MPSVPPKSGTARAIPLGIISLLLAIVIAVFGSQNPAESPHAFQIAFTIFFISYAGAMFVTASPGRDRFHRVIVGLLIIYTLSGFVGCQAIRHQTSASVKVKTSWGSYNRRPPGGKIADDRANSETLWFRVLALGIWGFGIFGYFRAIGTWDDSTKTLAPASSAPKQLSKRIAFPPLVTQTHFYGCFFRHDERYPGCAVNKRDLMMVLEAISNDLRAHRFNEVTWKLSGETSMSCRSADGRHFRMYVPPPIEPQISAVQGTERFGVFVKVAREPWEEINLTGQEQQSLSNYSANNDTEIFLCIVAIQAPTNCTDSTMTGFRLDFRGFTPLPNTVV